MFLRPLVPFHTQWHGCGALCSVGWVDRFNMWISHWMQFKTRLIVGIDVYYFVTIVVFYLHVLMLDVLFTANRIADYSKVGYLFKVMSLANLSHLLRLLYQAELGQAGRFHIQLLT